MLGTVWGILGSELPFSVCWDAVTRGISCDSKCPCSLSHLSSPIHSFYQKQWYKVVHISAHVLYWALPGAGFIRKRCSVWLWSCCPLPWQPEHGHLWSLAFKTYKRAWGNWAHCTVGHLDCHQFTGHSDCTLPHPWPHYPTPLCYGKETWFDSLSYMYLQVHC